MTEKHIYEISQLVFQQAPTQIIHQTIGRCNEVYELVLDSQSYILRAHELKVILYGTHKSIPLFKELGIKTPDIVAEDYSKSKFPFCYQILTKLEGKDLGVVIDSLNPEELRGIAEEISNIFDKFKSLPPKEDFGSVFGTREDSIPNMYEVVKMKKEGTLKNSESSQVLNLEVQDALHELIDTYRDYFYQVRPILYYDDINAKNVMIHEGKFTGLVDLDFMMKGDYLEAIGCMMACWYGEDYGEIYISEIIKLQKLSDLQQNIVRLYAILNLANWTSEAGVKTNSNTTSDINWERVRKSNERIMQIYASMKK